MDRSCGSVFLHYANIQKNWDITSNWQLIFPFLGIIGLLGCGYFVATRIMLLPLRT
ncbi:hypothetical protein JCM19275_797 [Nonlabens ulvanivorans]|uniref:Uncharacterized protein n=1 Tax=Nonlabens ulvanivorans TaxID=906888 RepID=A0A090WJJ6_NONUL|nr:hypothetical protein JCM19275_797 [Nonlabens ulvanivorans]